MNVSLEKIAELLKERDDFYILTHQYPDGDTLGSALALYYALLKLGKRAKVLCNDEIPWKYFILYRGVKFERFEPKCIVSVDVADTALLGPKLAKFEKDIDICIDHHSSSKSFAKFSYVEPDSAATAEIIFKLICELDVEIDKDMATCIYTGITTDTGCFKYANATARSYKIAAFMMEHGVNASNLNRLMFDTKSKNRIAIERHVLDTIEYFCEDRGALVYVTNEMIKKTGATPEDTDGIASIPRQIEGILVGVTIREKDNNIFKISVRTENNINAAKICQKLGGGGHMGAAGCTVEGTLEYAKNKVIKTIEEYFRENEV